MSEFVYFATLGLLSGTILIIFGMKYLLGIWQARAKVLSEAAYRTLAENAATSQSQIAPSLAAIRAELGEVRSSLAAIEKVLKAVE